MWLSLGVELQEGGRVRGGVSGGDLWESAGQVAGDSSVRRLGGGGAAAGRGGEAGQELEWQSEVEAVQSWAIVGEEEEDAAGFGLRWNAMELGGS